MEKKTLFQDESNSDDELNITFNQDYAKSYNKLRQKELLKKLKDQDSDSSTDSDESDSTEYGEIIDPKFDKEFFKTLASLKSKDPKIYDKSVKFFDDLEDKVESESNFKNKKTKPLTLKDYERKIILEKGGKFEDEDSGEEIEVKRAQSPSYFEEQQKIKSELKKALNESDDDNEEFGSIFKKRVKSKEENDKEDEDYVKWLAGQKDEIEDSAKTILKPLKQYWNDPQLANNERFLRDYVLNKGYVDTEVHEIPTYEEIVADSNFSDDEKELEKQAEFEHKYNFRYEEPDQEFIKRYPRTIESSVRRADDSRKRKRQEAKERKVQEKEEKMKELEMLKDLKRQEIEEKINKLKEVCGNDNLLIKEDELESDFDPDAHDRRMHEIFDEEYYKFDEGEEKPDCPDFEELKIEDWDNFDPGKEEIGDENDELHCEDENFNMDCDYDPNSKKNLQNELIENTKDRRKRKRKNKFMEMIKTEKPTFDPEDEKTYAEYIEEYYKMDCEDFIGEIPCRFKYVECEPNDFGLTIEEILLAKNKELNQWASLKKAVQIRPSYVDKKERRLYKMKAQNKVLKRKIFGSLYGEASEDEKDEEKSENKINNKEGNVNESIETGKVSKKRKKKKKSKLNNSNDNEVKQIKITENELQINMKGSSKNKDKVQNQPIKVEEGSTEKFVNNNSLKDVKDNLKMLQNINFEKSNKDLKKSNNLKVKSSIAENKNDSKDSRLDKNKFKKNSKTDYGIANKSKNIKKNFKQSKHDEKIISDERLKAYGLNPKKFHKNKNFFNNFARNKNFDKKPNNEKTKHKNPFG